MTNLISFFSAIFDWSGWLVIAPMAIFIIISEITRSGNQKNTTRK